MKKILIIGQLPKEYGGSYTTGVANVIVSLLPHISDQKFYKYLWASNLPISKNRDIFNTKIYGLNKFKVLYEIIKYFLKYPKRIFLFKKYILYGIDPLRNLIYEVSINQLIEKIDPDLIHVHNIGFLPSTFFANGNSKNILLTFHGIFCNDKNSIEQHHKNGVDLKKLFHNAAKIPDNFTVLTKDMKNEALTLFKLSPKSVNIIPNGVNQNFYYSNKERELLRKELNIDGEEVFISVGSLTKRKNHIGAIKFLRNNFDNFKYIIVGMDGDNEDLILKQIKNDSRILLLPYITNTDLFKYYSASDYFIMPSTQEGQALVCLEALSCGLQILINQKIIGSLGVEDSFLPYYKEFDLKQKNFKLPLRLNENEKDKLADLSLKKLGWDSVANKYSNIYDEIFN